MRIAAGVLRSRVVVGDEDDVSVLGGGASHERPLARVAVAACAEHDDEAALRHRPECCERARDGIGLVGIVDEDHRPVRAVAGELQAPGGAFELGEGGERVVDGDAGADG